MADSAHYILKVGSEKWLVNGEFLYDEEVLEMVGVSFADLHRNDGHANHDHGMPGQQMGHHNNTHRQSRPDVLNNICLVITMMMILTFRAFIF